MSTQIAPNVITWADDLDQETVRQATNRGERLDRAEKLLAAMREWCLEGEEPEMSPTLLDQVNSFLEEVD